MTRDQKNSQSSRQTAKAAKAAKLDLVFIQDTTASQDDYIKASVACCKDVCIALQASGELDKDKGLQMAVVAFRDHGDEYVTKDFGGFTYDVNTIQSNLSDLEPDGGGDLPEAVATALDKTLKLEWRDDAAKLAILITDASPHGIGEGGDDHYDGEPEPDGKDPLLVAREMAKRGIALLIVACEPTLSNDYIFAHDFYMALANITSGSVFPLTNTHILAPLIVGYTLERVALDSLALQYETLVTESHKKGMNQAQLSQKLHTLMRSRKTQVTTLQSTAVYEEPPEAAHAVATWVGAESTSAGRNQLLGTRIRPTPRVPETLFIPGPWAEKKVTVRMQNHGDTIIFYQFPKDGKLESKAVEHNHSEDETFLANKSYMFCLKTRESVRQTNKIFDKIANDWDLAQYF